MKRDAIKEFLRSVAGPNVKLVDHTKWVSFPCLFARFTHANGVDKNPSAGISISDERSIYNCHACGTKNTLPKILRALSKYTGEDYSELAEEAEDEELFGGVIPEWDAPRGGRDELPPPLDEEVFMDLYDSAVRHPYLRQRGITNKTAREIGLRVDPADSAGAERILFPVYHHKGGFYGFTGRATAPGVYPPIRDYHGLPKQFLLLGSHLLPKDAKYVIGVEGLFDYAKLYQYGFPVVAWMGACPTENQIRALIDIGLPFYFFNDNDTAGKQAQISLKATKLWRHIPVLKVRYPKREVKKRDGSVAALTDPDELTPEEINAMVADARLL